MSREMFQAMTDKELSDLARRASDGEELSNIEVGQLGAYAIWMQERIKDLEIELETTKDLIQETRDQFQIYREVDFGERDLMED